MTRLVIVGLRETLRYKTKTKQIRKPLSVVIPIQFDTLKSVQFHIKYLKELIFLATSDG